MAGSILNVIVNPRQFFEKKAGDAESLAYPALIILFQGLAGAISSYVVINLTATMYPAIGNLGGVLAIFGIISAIVGAFIFWIVLTAVLFGISILFKGEGSFRRTLEFVGYGSIPLVIGALVSGLILLQYAPAIPVPAVTSPEEVQQAVTALLKHPVLRLSSLIGIVMTIWSANLWIFGIRVARRLSMRDAALTVAIPVVAYIAYSVTATGFL
jgi:hypothetical protein